MARDLEEAVSALGVAFCAVVSVFRRVFAFFVFVVVVDSVVRVIIHVVCKMSCMSYEYCSCSRWACRTGCSTADSVCLVLFVFLVYAMPILCTCKVRSEACTARRCVVFAPNIRDLYDL